MRQSASTRFQRSSPRFERIAGRVLFGLFLLPALAQGQPWEGFKPDAEYVIRFVPADRCLDTGDPKGSSDYPQVHMHTCWESPVQRWRVNVLGTYRVPTDLKRHLLGRESFAVFSLQSVMDGRCIGFRGGDVREHAGATVGTCNGADDQSWIALDFGAAAAGGREVKFVSLKQLERMPGAPGLCLHIHHPSMVAQLRHCQRGGSQDLRVVERTRPDAPRNVRLTLDYVHALNQQEEGSGQDEAYFVVVNRRVHHTRELTLSDGQRLSNLHLLLWEGPNPTSGSIQVGLYESDGGRDGVLECAKKHRAVCATQVTSGADDDFLGAFEVRPGGDRGLLHVQELELEEAAHDGEAAIVGIQQGSDGKILRLRLQRDELVYASGAPAVDVGAPRLSVSATATYEVGLAVSYEGTTLVWKQSDDSGWYAGESVGEPSRPPGSEVSISDREGDSMERSSMEGQRLGYDRPVNESVARTPEPAATPPLTPEKLVGRYQREPVENDWHVGTIEPAPGGKLRWRNQAGVSWELTPDLASRKLYTSRENPYYDKGARAFDIATNPGGVTGFVFMGETYRRTGDAPTRTATPAPQPPPQVATAALTPESLVGTYQREPVENDWHVGRIQAVGDGTLRWTNDARASWGLRPDLANQKLHTDQQNPYYAGGAREFELVVEAGRVVGFRFQGELYRRTGN